MGDWGIFLLGAGLAMDAFAVALCEGLARPRFSLWHALGVGALFGLFQAGMPLAGFCAGRAMEKAVAQVDHWAAFLLLGGIGGKMLWDSRAGEAPREGASGALRLALLAVATSVDALAVGVTLAFLRVSIARACLIIGCVTFFLCFCGVALGRALGARARSGAQALGGMLLMGIGLKILLSHLFFP